jgi:arylsulfatase A-like enzyme/Flp pilus assembly protein TadD
MRRLLSLLVLLAPLPVAAAERPSVVLITLDTTRADRMGFLGNSRGLTPALDALAREGVVFERAYAQAPITTVSHATILSGTYPQSHKVNDFGVRLPDAVPYLPDLLRRAGYRTPAFVGSLILDPQNGLAPGFDRGFDTYDAGFHVRRGKEDRYQSMERRGEEVVSRALRWLDVRPPGEFLLWVHLYDAHDPYDPPGALARRFARAPYDGEVVAVDAAVGQLLAGLRTRGLLDAAAVAVFADHGEALGERGEKTHGVFLYDATQHVPLLLKLPRQRAAGQRVGSRVSLVDLAPTLLEAAALPVPAAMQGQSLLGLIGAPRGADRASYAETDYPRRAFGWSPLAAWRVDRFLFVEAPRRELSDLAADTGATRNLAQERGTLADRIAAEMAQFRARTGTDRTAPAAAPDPALVERLAALGYVGGAAAPPSGAGIDPKDKIEVANALHDAIMAIENGQMEVALPLLERVTATDPQIPVAQLQLGVARARLRRYAQAVPALRRAIELQPDSMQAHYEMGLALFQTGQWPTAAGHFEIVAARMPRWADARFSLGSVYARIDRVAEAVRELRAALEVAPAHYRANLLLGRIFTLQREAASALPYLERAASSPSASAEAHAFLAEAYEALGRVADAGRARNRARAMRPPGP